MSIDSRIAKDTFHWEPQPAAARLVGTIVKDFCSRSRRLAEFKSRLLGQTGTRLVDWIDHLSLPAQDTNVDQLASAGFVPNTGSHADAKYWRCESGMFPTLRTGGERYRIAIQVDSVDDFLASGRRNNDDTLPLDWPLPGMFRVISAFEDHGIELCAVERHGYTGFDPVTATPKQLKTLPDHLAAFHARPRAWDEPPDGFAAARRLFDLVANDLGRSWACDLFFQAEREYWQSRNRAAGIQYARQQRLGLGWANHDHHTYRSSRAYFANLIDTLEHMGFVCRERFYAGREAGWGAQVLEQSDCGLVVFADVDLSPEEVNGDFAHEPLPKRDELGTVGLWCRLHGEAFLQSGMHHLECQFDFDAARAQLEVEGVRIMAPFTDFEFLKQAFTDAEMWNVDQECIVTLLDSGLISSADSERFRTEGARGSHLEILERNDGYKGFNQTGINDIILRTDPRR